MKLAALAVVILALGIVAGFVFRGSVFEAEAKPPAPEPTGGRTILVAENVTLQGGATHTTGFIATADCRALSVFTEGSGDGTLTRRLALSADGVVTIVGLVSGPRLNGETVENNVTVFGTSVGPILAPFVAVQLVELQGGNASVTVDKAWLYCAR